MFPVFPLLHRHHHPAGTLTESLAGPYPFLVDADTVIVYLAFSSMFFNKSDRFDPSTFSLIAITFGTAESTVVWL